MSNLNAKSINVGRLNVTENFIYHRGKKTKMLDVDASGNLCLTNSIFSNEPFKLGINICPGTTVTDGSANQILNAALDISGGLQLAFNDVTTMPTPGNLGSVSFFKDGNGNYRFFVCEMDTNGVPTWRAMTESHAQTSYWTKNDDNLYYNAGNVGIGTNIPTFRLEVASDPTGVNVNSMKLDDIMSWTSPDGSIPSRCRFLAQNLAISTQNTFWQLDTNNGNVELFDNVLYNNGTPYKIKFATLTPENVTFEFGAPTQTGTYIFNGNVGIGTTSPDYLLDVSGNAGTIQSSLCRGKDPHFKTVTWSSNSNQVDAVVGAIGLYYKANEASMVKFHRGVNGEDGFMSFTTGVAGTTTGGQERMRLDNLGRLGIGTQAPQAKLDVSGNIILSNSGKKQLIFHTTGGGGGNQAKITSRENTGGGIKFLTGEATAPPSTKMVIIGNGNIGIGQPPDNNGDNWSGNGSPYHGLSANVDVGISGELYADKSVYIGYNKWNFSA
ncbi:MAG: hypothetical protein V3W20_01310, partial [Candidatus Neomarinimicrobiota bacterium]